MLSSLGTHTKLKFSFSLNTGNKLWWCHVVFFWTGSSRISRKNILFIKNIMRVLHHPGSKQYYTNYNKLRIIIIKKLGSKFYAVID